MLRTKLYYTLVLLAAAFYSGADAQSVAPFEMSQDDYAETVDEEVVETVNLGGEDNVQDGRGGVGQADSYEQTADPESPLNVNTGVAGGEDEAPVVAPGIKPVVPVDDLCIIR